MVLGTWTVIAKNTEQAVDEQLHHNKNATGHSVLGVLGVVLLVSRKSGP